MISCLIYFSEKWLFFSAKIFSQYVCVIFIYFLHSVFHIWHNNFAVFQLFNYVFPFFTQFFFCLQQVLWNLKTFYLDLSVYVKYTLLANWWNYYPIHWWLCDDYRWTVTSIFFFFFFFFWLQFSLNVLGIFGRIRRILSAFGNIQSILGK